MVPEQIQKKHGGCRAAFREARIVQSLFPLRGGENQGEGERSTNPIRPVSRAGNALRLCTAIPRNHRAPRSIGCGFAAPSLCVEFRAHRSNLKAIRPVFKTGLFC